MQKNVDIILLLFLSLFSGCLQAQMSVNIDSLFRQAQDHAFSGAYEPGRQLCRQILQYEPEHADAALLMGRTFAWQGQYDSARFVLRPLVQQELPPADAFVALADVELWVGLPEKSLQYTNKGLEQYSTSVPLLLSKARALQALQKFTAADKLLEAVFQLETDNKDAENLSRQLKEMSGRTGRNTIKARYQISTFSSGLTPWQLGTLEYSRAAAKGKYLFRLNYAEQFEKKSLQVELDAYPKLGRKTYAYLNAGVSDRNLFPSFRGGAELFHVFPGKVEASLGARGLYFEEETVVLYTGHISKYFSRYWLAFRPFVQEINSKWQVTGLLQLRQYLEEDAYIGLMVAKGTTPSEQVGIQEIVRLDASRFDLEGQFRLGDNYLAGAVLSYEFEELLHDNFRHRFTTGITVQRKF